MLILWDFVKSIILQHFPIRLPAFYNWSVAFQHLTQILRRALLWHKRSKVPSLSGRREVYALLRAEQSMLTKQGEAKCTPWHVRSKVPPLSRVKQRVSLARVHGCALTPCGWFLNIILTTLKFYN